MDFARDKKMARNHFADLGSPLDSRRPSERGSASGSGNLDYDAEKASTAVLAKGWLANFADSFKEMPSSVGGRQTDYLARELKGRHLQMIAIGGAVGSGLFVGSGETLANGGPAALVIAFGLIGIMLYCTVQAMGELAVAFPVAGSFSVYGSRFLDPAWGFAMGWNYALSWLVTIPLEITAAALTIGYWPGAANVNPAAWVSIFLVTIITINLFGARGYGEAEFIFSIVKVIAIISFILLSIIINIGGGEDGGYIGGKYWRDPGAFNNGFKGVCSVFVTAAFAFSGTELVGLAAAETANPRKTLPPAIKQVFWRILIFYMISLTLIGLNVPSTDPELLSESNPADATASPFVLSIQNAGISVLPSIFNVVILIAVLSVGNSCIYGSSRTLAALADQGQAPKWLGYIDRRGRPLYAILFSSLWGLIAFVAAVGKSARNNALGWLISTSGLAVIFTWGSINLCHIRFRAAWKYNGHSLDELAFTSQAGVIGSYLGFGFNALVLIAQFWTGAFPIGYSEDTPTEQVESFWEAYLSVPVAIVCFVGFKIWRKTKFVRVKDIDIMTGRRELNIKAIMAEEREEQLYWPRWKRWYRFWC